MIMKKRLTDNKVAGFFYKRKFRWFNRCVYCGEPADCLDHVFPLSLASGLDLARPSVKSELKQGLNLVPCCNSCNGFASNRPFTLIREKRAWIQAKIKKKYKRHLRQIEFDDDELAEFGRNLLDFVNASVDRRNRLLSRITFPLAG